MNKDNFWTDELVGEYTSHVLKVSNMSIEAFKQSKTPKKEWEIVSFELGGMLSTLMEDGKYHNEEGTSSYKYALENQNIHSVKRLSDGEVFTVGDEVEYREGDAVDWGYICGEGKINWIKEGVVQKDKMEVEINDNHEWSSNHYPHKYLENVRHKLPPQPKPEQPFPYFKPANQNFDKYGAPEQPKKERIVITQYSNINIPEEKFPAIKAAIERVLNDEVSVDLPTLDGTTIHCQK